LKKRKRTEVVTGTALPHVVEKGLVTEEEARELFNIFFSGCQQFVPLFDPSYDTYEGLAERSPWTFDAILAIAAKIRSGNGPLGETFYKALEEAQDIARSSLFGRVVKKEAVQGMLLLAAWSTNGWLPSGHALRMALDLGLDHALTTLADKSTKSRPKEEQRDFVTAARTWLCIYWFDHQSSMATGRPVLFRDEGVISRCRIILQYSTLPTDVRLISLVELAAQKMAIHDAYLKIAGPVNERILEFFRRANDTLDKWWKEHDDVYHRAPGMDMEPVIPKLLLAEINYAKLWISSLALRNASWTMMTMSQHELSFQARDAALVCLTTILDSPEARASLRCAIHDSLVMVAFSALYLLKIASIFPREIDISMVGVKADDLGALLVDAGADRYWLALRIVQASVRRKVMMQTGVPLTCMLPVLPVPAFAAQMAVPPPADHDPAAPPPFKLEELGLASPFEGAVLDPAAIPAWLQEQNLSDLGLPEDGYDGIFMRGSNGWSGEFPPVPAAW